jgi:protein SCO1/2
MLDEKDPLAMSLYNQYKKVRMPNMGLSRQDVEDLISYMKEQTEKLNRDTIANSDVKSVD